MQNMCGPLARAHIRARVSSHHRILSLDEVAASPELARPVGVCGEHKQLFRYFDQACGCLVCYDCVALDHSGHKFQSISAAIKASQEAIEPSVATAKQRAQMLSDAEEQVNLALKTLRDGVKEQEAKLDQYFQEVRGGVLPVVISVSPTQLEGQVKTQWAALRVSLNEAFKVKENALLLQQSTLQQVRACLVSAAEHATVRLGRAGLAELIEVDKDARKLLANVATEPVRVNADTFLAFSASSEAARAIARAGRVRRREEDAEPFVTTKKVLSGIVAEGATLVCALAKDDAKNYAHVQGCFKNGVFDAHNRKWSCCGASDAGARGCCYMPPASLAQYSEAALSQLVDRSQEVKDVLALCPE